MIPDEIVDRVREAADIVQVIGEHVALRRTGTDWRGPCPFHQGKHRNFSVSPRKRIFYCFVCHEGGDVFSFLQKRLGLDWPAAVRLVAEKSGIEVREVEAPRGVADPREPLWEAAAAAAEYFQRTLWQHGAAGEAREYLASRRIPREVAERFGLGFAPRDPALLGEHLSALGYDQERLLAAGLLLRREGEDQLRPRFRGRLMFPILDAMGRHVGFGGRLLGPGEPKYLNSPESEVFSKGRLLYGLSWARHAIRREERALLVEGYFDVVRLVAAGIEPVVAPLGTALTEEQAKLVTRYTKTAYLLYDSDLAGLKATFRAGDELLRQGVAVQVVTLPEGEDPDTFVDRHGASALSAELARAIDIFERKVQILEREGWFSDLARKRRALDKLLPTIRATADPLTRDIYVARASEVSGVSRDLLLRELLEAGEPRGARRATSSDAADAPPGWHGEAQGSGERSASGRGSEKGFPPGERRSPRGRRRTGDRRGSDGRLLDAPPTDLRPIQSPPVSRGEAPERELTRIMLHLRSQVDAIAARIGVDTFRDPRYRQIFAALRDLGAEASVEELAQAVDDDAAREMQRLLADPGVVAHPTADARRTVADALARLQERELNERIDALNARLAQPGEEHKDSLLAEINRTVAERNQLGAKSYRFGKRP